MEKIKKLRIIKNITGAIFVLSLILSIALPMWFELYIEPKYITLLVFYHIVVFVYWAFALSKFQDELIKIEEKQTTYKRYEQVLGEGYTIAISNAVEYLRKELIYVTDNDNPHVQGSKIESLDEFLTNFTNEMQKKVPTVEYVQQHPIVAVMPPVVYNYL